MWLARIKRWMDFKKRGIVVWMPSNIYPTARIGDNVSVGMFSEVGKGVTIGKGTRIGMGVFLPEGVRIGRNCFIGPKVCMVHDSMMHVPPFPVGHQKEWKPIVVKDEVRIGANAMILPGVTIGTGAIIGMGAVVTKDVGHYEVWFGNPARKIRSLIKEDCNG